MFYDVKKICWQSGLVWDVSVTEKKFYLYCCAPVRELTTLPWFNSCCGKSELVALNKNKIPSMITRSAFSRKTIWWQIVKHAVIFQKFSAKLSTKTLYMMTKVREVLHKVSSRGGGKVEKGLPPERVNHIDVLQFKLLSTLFSSIMILYSTLYLSFFRVVCHSIWPDWSPHRSACHSPSHRRMDTAAAWEIHCGNSSNSCSYPDADICPPCPACTARAR